MRHLTALALLCCALPAFAANNPVDSGLSSNGDFAVSVTKGELIRVSNLADIVLPVYAVMPADTTQGIDLCVFSTTGGYNLTAASSNASVTQPRLSNGTNTINYTLSYFDGAATQTLPHGVNQSGFINASTADELCFGGTNATLSVNILAADFNAVPQGIYSDTLTLTFNAE